MLTFALGMLNHRNHVQLKQERLAPHEEAEGSSLLSNAGVQEARVAPKELKQNAEEKNPELEMQVSALISGSLIFLTKSCDGHCDENGPSLGGSSTCTRFCLFEFRKSSPFNCCPHAPSAI